MTTWVLALVLIAAVIAVYWPALGAGYVYDDNRLILHNPFIDGPLDWSALFLDKRSVATDEEPDIYRPLSTLAFYVEHRLGSGSPIPHHLAGIALHLLNSLLFFVVLSRLIGVLRPSTPARWPAFFGAALFALHPVQVESVAWISSRSGQISALFILLGLLALNQGGATGAPRRPGAALLRYLLVGAATFLACLARESGVMTGVFVLIGAVCLGPLRRRDVFASGLSALAAAILYLLLRHHVMDGALHQVPPHGGGWFENLLYGAYGCFYQFGLLFRPWFHNLDFQDGFFDEVPFWQITAGACAYFALTTAALLSFARRPLAACGVLLVLAAQFPTSSLVITVRSLVNDRYLYLPLMGVGVIACAAAISVGQRGALLRRTGSILLVALLIVLGVLTHDRSRDWKDSRSLWTTALETHPGSIRAHVALSKVYLQEGDAERALKTAVAGYTIARPGTAVRMNAMYKATQALSALGRDAACEGPLEELLAEASHPGRSENFRLFERASLDLLVLKVRGSRFDDAARVVEALIEQEGPSPINFYRLGIALEHAGRPDDAEDAFVRGAALPGDFADIHFHLADIYERTGREELARSERRKGEEKAQRKKESSQLEP